MAQSEMVQLRIRNPGMTPSKLIPLRPLAHKGADERKAILYVQYTNPGAYPPLSHSALLMAEAGWDVLLFGIAVEDTLRIAGHPRIQVDLIPPSPPGMRQKLHYIRFAQWALAKARSFQPSWVYASDPLSCPAGLLMAMRTGAGLIYHEHDSPDGTQAAHTPFMRAVLHIRRHAARRAALCVLPNAQRVETFRRSHLHARTLTVANFPLRQEVQSSGGPRATANVLRLLYHGSLVPARLPLTVIDALSMLPAGVTLVLVGYETAGSRGYVDTLKCRARDLGVEDRLIVVGTIPRADLLRHAATCDVGLALVPLQTNDLNERTMVGASNKPFDYMACGLALIVSDLPAWRATFVDPGYALPCNPESAGSVAGAIERLIRDPQLRRGMGEAGRAKILETWNYDRAFAPVFAVLNNSTTSGPAMLAVPEPVGP